MFVRFYSRKKSSKYPCYFFNKYWIKMFWFSSIGTFPFPILLDPPLCARPRGTLNVQWIFLVIDLFIYISCTSISYLTSTYAFYCTIFGFPDRSPVRGRHVHSISPNNHYISPFNLSISFRIKFKLKSICLIEMTIILQTAYNNEACNGYMYMYIELCWAI